MNEMEFNEGDVVEVIDTFNRLNSVLTTGNVERVTKTQIVILTASGNEMRFRVKDNLQVGFAFPQLMLAIRRLDRAFKGVE